MNVTVLPNPACLLAGEWMLGLTIIGDAVYWRGEC